jgi:plastocyanin
MSMLRTIPALAAAAAAIILCSPAFGAGLKGVIKLPSGFTARPAFSQPGYWLLPNDVIEIRPPMVDPRMKMVVVLEGSGLSVKAGVKPEVTMSDARITPEVLPVQANQKITFSNKDSTVHNLEALGTKFMQSLRLLSNSTATRSIDKPGAYRLHCTEVPHMVSTILVVTAPQFTLPDAAGAFDFSNIPAGSYTLKIWYSGKWVHSQPVAVKGRTRVEVLLKKDAGKD